MRYIAHPRFNARQYLRCVHCSIACRNLHLNYEDIAIIAVKEGTLVRLTPPSIHDGTSENTRALHNQSIFDLLDGRNIEVMMNGN